MEYEIKVLPRFKLVPLGNFDFGDFKSGFLSGPLKNHPSWVRSNLMHKDLLGNFWRNFPRKNGGLSVFVLYINKNKKHIYIYI